MLILEITYNGTITTQVLLDPWDLKKDKILHPNMCMSEDAGKYVLFTDGSRVLAKLNSKSHQYLLTSNGVFYQNEYVLCCKPKKVGSMYSGLMHFDQHLMVHKPSKREQELLTEAFEGKRTSKSLSPRVYAMLLEKLQTKLAAHGVDEEFIVKQLKDEATNPRNRGADRIEAVKVLARIGGVEVGGMTTTKQAMPLFGNVQHNITIQDKRRTELSHIDTISIAMAECEITDAQIVEEPVEVIANV